MKMAAAALWRGARLANHGSCRLKLGLASASVSAAAANISGAGRIIVSA
jgi:hypothetical protein